MPFDGIVMRAVILELQEKLTGGRITRIHQPTKTELIFTVRNHRKNYSLLFSVHPTYARFHITEDVYENPKEPPMFCMHLRKYLSGGFIEQIEQVELERIALFKIQARDEIGDQTSKYIVLELMGRHSNVLLLDEKKEKIIDCLKHIPPFQNRYRTLRPGHPYIPPPSQNKLNPLKISGEEFLKQLDFNAARLDRQIVNCLMGVSPFFAREMVARAHLGDASVYKKMFSNVQQKLLKAKFKPMIYKGDQRDDFHVLPITSVKGKSKAFSTAQQMLDAFYSGKAERDRIKQQTKNLKRLLQNELKKNERKLKLHQKTIQQAKQAKKYQKYGELLTAHMHLVSPGDASVTVVDYYDPEQKEIKIPLNPEQSPSENAQRFFTRYRKLKASEKIITQEIKKTKEEIIYLEALMQQIETARTDDLADIREELQDQGYLRKQQKPKQRKKSKPNPERFQASDGTTIYVGRNNRQNEYLTHRLAHRKDFWLHTKDIPGSHVVIRDHQPSEKTLYEAAQLAAYFSRAKQSASVPVDYTQIKHVKKPTGAKPGFVIYEQEKTIFVTPKESMIKKLHPRKLKQ